MVCDFLLCAERLGMLYGNHIYGINEDTLEKQAILGKRDSINNRVRPYYVIGSRLNWVGKVIFSLLLL